MKNPYIFLGILVISCSNLKTVYTAGELNTNGYAEKKIFEKFQAQTPDKSVVVFTASFEKDTITILNGNKEIFKSEVETTPQTGFSGFWVVSNLETVELIVNKPNGIKIKFKQEDLKKYKFVYLSRDAWKRDKYEIEYSNKWKKFM